MLDMLFEENSENTRLSRWRSGQQRTSKMTSLAKLRERLLTDPEVKAEYDRLGPIFAVVGEMIEARHAAGLTQTDIAARMGTSKSVVARLENARHMPTFEMMARYAAAIGRRIDIHLAPSVGERSASEAIH
jgi:ribosome-binding protein aMBF1 (putative translation factor)